jgi:hypothetical protein
MQSSSEKMWSYDLQESCDFPEPEDELGELTSLHIVAFVGQFGTARLLLKRGDELPLVQVNRPKGLSRFKP